MRPFSSSLDWIKTMSYLNKNMLKQILVWLMIGCMAVSMAGCSPAEETQGGDSGSTVGQMDEAETTAGLTEIVDYATAVKLNMASDTVKQEVTVKTFIDGDTVHFHVPSSVNDTGVLKARFLAINTPDSTGKIEEYGKKASQFTREKLSAATSIVIESEDGQWNPDSTGDRYLVWVWYKTAQDEDYRNLNIEILQNGLAIANSSANNRYGSTCMSAIAQAKAQKLYVYSGEKDPDFYYGEAVELTLKELRTNIEAYNGIKVAFNGVITMNSDNSVYVESYDAETGLYYGITVYYGFGLNGEGLNILKVGNEARIVGSVQYYEAGGTYQVSDVSYRQMKPDDPNNLQKISDGHSAAYTLVDADTFAHGKVEIATEEGTSVYDYAELAMDTSIQMKNLLVTEAELRDSSASDGLMVLTCEADGAQVQICLADLRGEGGEPITEETYLDQIIDVKGYVDYFSGDYQIRVFSQENITIVPQTINPRS